MNVYDFDNTIYDGESALDFFFYYIKKTPWLIRYIPKVFYALFRYKAGKITIEKALEDYAPFVEDYLSSIEDIRADSVEFWDSHMKNIKPFYKDIQRPDDVIVTASPEITMEEICRRLGIGNCIGTVIDEKTNRIKRLCMRSNKVRAFREVYPDAVIENFYTDSPENDKHLIDLSVNAYLVRKNKIIKIK